MTSINIGDVGTATSTAAAATVNHTQGQITTESITTAAGANYVFTLTNNCIYPASLVFVSVQVGGTNTKLPISILSIVTTAGQAVITFQNNNAAALNGTLVFNFLVV